MIDRVVRVLIFVLPFRTLHSTFFCLCDSRRSLRPIDNNLQILAIIVSSAMLHHVLNDKYCRKGLTWHTSFRNAPAPDFIDM